VTNELIHLTVTWTFYRMFTFWKTRSEKVWRLNL